MASDPFALLVEVAEVLPVDRWMLVGGLMVHAHATLAEVENNRPTHDADIAVSAGEMRAVLHRTRAWTMLATIPGSSQMTVGGGVGFWTGLVTWGALGLRR